MDNIIQNQTIGIGTDYSEIYQKLRQEVSEQNKNSAHIMPKAILSDKDGDTIELRIGNPQTKEIDKLKESEVKNAVAALLFSIKQQPSSVYEAQNNMLASRIVALLKS